MTNGIVRGHEHSADCCNKFRVISWMAILTGALVAVGLSFLFNLFNVAIGLAVFVMQSGGELKVAIGGLIGLAIGLVISMFVAGWVAGWLGRPNVPDHNLGILYGFVTWTVSLIISMLLVSYISRYVIFYTTSTGNPFAFAFSDGTAPQQINQAASSVMGWGTFLVFVLFFIGAISTCFGAVYGMHYKDNE